MSRKAVFYSLYGVRTCFGRKCNIIFKRSFPILTSNSNSSNSNNLRARNSSKTWSVDTKINCINNSIFRWPRPRRRIASPEIIVLLFVTVVVSGASSRLVWLSVIYYLLIINVPRSRFVRRTRFDGCNKDDTQ